MTPFELEKTLETMDIREKLVELLDQFIYDDWYGSEEIADRLIANGVTVQDVPDNNVGKWISVKDRLPERKCDCLTVRKGDVYVESWNGVLFSERNQHGQPTHWMPLPQPPKGDLK